MGPRRRFGIGGAPGMIFVGSLADGTNSVRFPPPYPRPPSLYSTGTPAKISPSSSHADTYISFVRGLYEGEYQFVPPWTAGYVGIPGGCGVLIGRPFASKPLIQLMRTNGLPRRNVPFVRSST